MNRKIIQFLLRSGLTLTVLLLSLGISIHLLQGQMQARSVKLFHLLSPELTIGDQLLGLGVLILAMTPALRVLTLLVLWMREKDWKFVGISGLVVLMLIISIYLGGG